MSDDELFRRILLAGFLLFVPVAAYHRLKSRTGERLDRKQEGWFILITLRLVGAATLTGLIFYLVNPALMTWGAVPLPVWGRWAGVALDLLAGLLLVWTLHSLGRNLTDTVVTRKAHTLVTAGPYRWVRHPFYGSVVLLVLANSLAAANLFLLVTGATVFLLQVVRTRKEEENLLARFGPEYRNYMERTGRFMPRLGKSSGFS
jgi:protein-S-isoprenylcysteine O-methyltransferase Ste14